MNLMSDTACDTSRIRLLAITYVCTCNLTKAGFKIVHCMTLLRRAAKKKMTLSSPRSPWRCGNGKYIVTNLHSSSEAGAMDGSHHRLPTVLQSLDHSLTSPGDLLQLGGGVRKKGKQKQREERGVGTT